MTKLINFGNKKIHSSSIEGEFKHEKDYVKTRIKFEDFLVDEMRSKGRVPVLDMASSWSTSYDEEKDKFYFKLTMHSVYVGKTTAQEILGIESNGATYPL